jgi:hypothetical protein
MRFGTWNVNSLYRTGSLTTAARELARYKLDLVVFLISNFRRVLNLHQAFEDGPDRGFRNVGTTHSDAGKIPKRKYTRFSGCAGGENDNSSFERVEDFKCL